MLALAGRDDDRGDVGSSIIARLSLSVRRAADQIGEFRRIRRVQIGDRDDETAG